MHSIKHNWTNKNFDFNKFSITNEEFNDLSGDTKYKNLQNLLKKIQKLKKAKSRTAGMKKEKILWAMQFLKHYMNRHKKKTMNSIIYQKQKKGVLLYIEYLWSISWWLWLWWFIFVTKLWLKSSIHATNHLLDINFKDFMKLYKYYTKGPFSILENKATLLSDNPLGFRKNLL